MRHPGSRGTMRVVIAGDTPASVGALVQALTAHDAIDVVGLAGNSREALGLVETLAPHAVLVELAKTMSSDAIAAIRTLGARVIVLSDSADPAGADGVIARSADLAEAFYTAASLALELGPEQ
jgi:DNA-binding NarL/FixJ family response regulator